jgi:hypothetical protein
VLPVRISSFGFLSDFGLGASDFAPRPRPRPRFFSETGIEDEGRGGGRGRLTNLLQIAFLWLNLTNFVTQVEPGPTNSAYYTNFYGTNLVVSGMATVQAFIGPTVQLSWKQESGTVYVQGSSNLVDWMDIRVAQIGGTNWLALPGDERRFWRLRRG